jgi:hypothetical protein
MNRTPRAAAVAALAAAALAAVAGCGSSAPSGATSSTTPTQAAATTSPAATSPAAPSSSPATPPPVSLSVPPAVPTLGQVAGDFDHGQGFGQVRPQEIYNGGDPTGLVTKITWQSWGGATATGTGTATYVAGNEPVAAGTQEPATVVAFKLGTCSGKLMYQAVEWYFPQHGQSFSAAHYEDICAGTYVPGS